MESGKKRTSNKGLVAILCVLVAAIVGLSVGIAVMIANNEENDGQEMIDDGGADEEVEGMIADYQEKIDAANSDEEKAELYEKRCSLLIDTMNNNGESNYCLEVADDLGNLIELTNDNSALERLILDMPDKCVQRGQEEVVVVSEGDEGGEQ